MCVMLYTSKNLGCGEIRVQRRALAQEGRGWLLDPVDLSVSDLLILDVFR
jgi:hypothetical protein